MTDIYPKKLKGFVDGSSCDVRQCEKKATDALILRLSSNDVDYTPGFALCDKHATQIDECGFGYFISKHPLGGEMRDKILMGIRIFRKKISIKYVILSFIEGILAGVGLTTVISFLLGGG